MTTIQPKINQSTFQATKINKPDNKPQNKKQTGMSTTGKVLVGATALAAIVIAGIALKGKIKPKNLQSVEQAVNNVSEKVLSNGKKITKTVEKTKDGADKVIMNIFDDKGVLQCTREKVIKRTVNPKNGKKYITIDKKYTSPLPHYTNDKGNFIKELSDNTNKYYTPEGRIFFRTSELKYGDGTGYQKFKNSSYNFDGVKKTRSISFTHRGKPDVRSGYIDLMLDNNGQLVSTPMVYCNGNGIVIKKPSNNI